MDLSTDLNALMPLVAPLISGHSDVAYGSQLNRNSRVVRGPKREFISRTYNLILHASLQVRFSDAQCGFKAIRTDVARQLLPLVEDKEWFFDTELLVLAERVGLRIHEVPVDWVDDPDSRVDIVDTVRKDLLGIWRLGRALMLGTLPLEELRHSLGREPLVEGVPAGMVGQLVRFESSVWQAHWPMPCCSWRCTAWPVTRRPTSLPCSSPRCSTPRPTASSPSGYAVGVTLPNINSRGSSSSASGSP